jgi:hypothetical protein
MNAPAKTNLTQSILSAMHSRRFTIYYHQRPNSRHWFSCLPPDWRFFKDLGYSRIHLHVPTISRRYLLAVIIFNCSSIVLIYLAQTHRQLKYDTCRLLRRYKTCQNTRIVYRCVSCFIHTDHLFIYLFFFNSLLSFTICDHLWLYCWLRWEKYIAAAKIWKRNMFSLYP